LYPLVDHQRFHLPDRGRAELWLDVLREELADGLRRVLQRRQMLCPVESRNGGESSVSLLTGRSSIHLRDGQFQSFADCLLVRVLAAVKRQCPLPAFAVLVLAEADFPDETLSPFDFCDATILVSWFSFASSSIT
jgi:hypothetical protein